jgi:hypothetical protein
MWKHAKSIRVIERADGNAKIDVLAGHDGFYEDRGETEIHGDEYQGVYRSPTERSGLFESAYEVKHAVFDDVPWLGQQMRKPSESSLRCSPDERSDIRVRSLIPHIASVHGGCWLPQPYN